jgi:hypothetical protein
MWRHTKFVREGAYGAEVDVELIDEGNGWSPYLSLDDARKLDTVREALRRADLETASRLARVFAALTKLLGPAEWTYYSLYVILDIFSRYVFVQLTVAEPEQLSSAQFLHSVAPVRSGPILQTCVFPSHLIVTW